MSIIGHTMRIEGAQASDLAGIQWLLEYERLPVSDLDERSLEKLLVCRDEQDVRCGRRS